MEHFQNRVPILDYLPYQKVVSKIPRQFYLDVFLEILQNWKILRTLDTEEFDRFVQSNIAGRQRKFIQKNNLQVSILPQFAAKIQASNLISSILFVQFLHSKERKSSHDSKRIFQTKKNTCRARNS